MKEEDIPRPPGASHLGRPSALRSKGAILKKLLIIGAAAVVMAVAGAGCGGGNDAPGQPEGSAGVEHVQDPESTVVRDDAIQECLDDPDGYTRGQCECVIDGAIAIVGVDTVTQWAADERAGREDKQWEKDNPDKVGKLLALAFTCLGDDVFDEKSPDA